MTTRAARFWGAVGATWLLAAGAGAEAGAGASAPPVPTASLVQPSDLFEVTSSPSGARVAGLRRNGDQVYLLVSQWQGGQLRPVISTYYLPRYHSVEAYRWLSDNYLLLQVEDLLSGWQIPVLAGIADNIWRPLPVFSELVEYPWSNPDQALLQDSGSVCRDTEMSFCLFSLNLNHWGGDLVSAPLRLLPVAFLAVSPGEIYASGQDLQGRHQEYRLGGNQGWQHIADGTVAQRRASLAQTQQPSAAMMQAAAHVGIHHPRFVLTAGAHRLVGILGRAPEPAFVALDARLEGLQAFLASHYPSARVSISGLDDALTRGQVTVWDTDLPPTPYFLQPDGSVGRFAPAMPKIGSDRLGQTHMEPVWAPGASVAVTMPPDGVALVGAVVTPVLAAASALEDPLHEYRAQLQALAQQGIAVVQLLAPIPDSFTSDSAGAAWRAAFEAQLSEVVASVGSQLLHGGLVCLYGEGLAGELALAASGLAQVGCTVAVNPILNASRFSKTTVMGLPVGRGGLVFRLVGPTVQMLNRDFPAAFGNPLDQLNDAVGWVPGLPDNLLLAYDTDRYVDSTRGYSAGDFAAASAAFRAAARRAGKHVQYYGPDVRFDPFLQRQGRMIDAVSRYVRGYYAGIPAAARG